MQSSPWITLKHDDFLMSCEGHLFSLIHNEICVRLFASNIRYNDILGECKSNLSRNKSIFMRSYVRYDFIRTTAALTANHVDKQTKSISQTSSMHLTLYLCLTSFPSFILPLPPSLKIHLSGI